MRYVLYLASEHRIPEETLWISPVASAGDRDGRATAAHEPNVATAVHWSAWLRDAMATYMPRLAAMYESIRLVKSLYGPQIISVPADGTRNSCRAGYLCDEVVLALARLS